MKLSYRISSLLPLFHSIFVHVHTFILLSISVRQEFPQRGVQLARLSSVWTERMSRPLRYLSYSNTIHRYLGSLVPNHYHLNSNYIIHSPVIRFASSYSMYLTLCPSLLQALSSSTLIVIDPWPVNFCSLAASLNCQGTPSSVTFRYKNNSGSLAVVSCIPSTPSHLRLTAEVRRCLLLFSTKLTLTL